MMSSPGGKDAAVNWPLSVVLPAAAMLLMFIFAGGLCFFLLPFGWSSQWSWGSVWELHRSSSSRMACSAVLPFATLALMCLMKKLVLGPLLSGSGHWDTHQGSLVPSNPTREWAG